MIGVFDSGYGGLTVLHSLVNKLPEYDYMYLGDNARAPYGPRSFDTVYEYTLQAVKWLFDQGCELVVLACNTASAKALRTIQQKDLPSLAPGKRVLGVIRPTAEVIGQYSTSGHIGILATAGTVISCSYPLEINKFYPSLHVYQQACPMLVPLIENNEHLSEGADYFIQKCIDGLMLQSPDIDTILLGCTHYPLIEKKIKALAGPKVKVLGQGGIVADSLQHYLERHPEMETRLSKSFKRVFFTTDSSQEFDKQASLFYGETVQSLKVVL